MVVFLRNKKIYFLQVIFTLLLFLLLILMNAIKLNLSISDLNGSNVFNIQYLFIKAINNNTQIELTNDKYLINNLSIELNDKTLLNLNIGKTISRTHILNDLSPKLKLVKFTISKQNSIEPDKLDQFKLIKLFIFSIVVILSVNIFLWSLRKIYFTSSKYVRSYKLNQNKLDGISHYYPYAFLLITMITLFLAYVTHFINLDIFFSSDELFLIDLFNNLSAGGEFSNWYLTTVPFYFPDYLIFGIAYLITKTPYWSFICFAELQLLITVFLLTLFLKKLIKTTSAFLLATLTVFIWVISAIFFEAFQPIILSVFHFGCITNIIIFGILILNFIEPYPRNNVIQILAVFFIFSLSCIFVISDLWFIVWCIIPFTLAVIYTKLINKKILINYYVVAAGFIGGLIGLFLARYAVYHYVTLPITVSIFHIGMLAKKIFYLVKFINDHYVLVIINIIFFIGLNTYLKNQAERLSNNILLVINYLRMLFVILIVVFIVDKIDFNLRYFLPLIFFVSSFVMIYLTFRYDKLVLNIVLVSMSLFIIYLLTKHKYPDYYPTDIECIDKSLLGSDASNGAAQYWVARRFNYLTKTNKHIFPINGKTGEHFIWQDNVRHMRNDYDFVITDNTQTEKVYLIDSKEVIGLNGYLVDQQKCDNNLIMIYQNK